MKNFNVLVPKLERPT